MPWKIYVRTQLSLLVSNLAWQASEKISLGLVGQDLLRNLHQEYAGPDLTVLPSLIRRNAYARIAWRVYT